jgi:hypothetical protein
MFVLPQDINYSPNLSIHEKNLLRALADHCGSKDVCWPSVETLGRFMNVGVRTVQKYLRRVTELRFVEVVRKPGKTNLYRVICLEERKPLTPPQEFVHPEQNTSEPKKRLTATVVGSWKSPREIKILVEDLSEIVGPVEAERNRGWLWKIAQAVKDEWIYETISWLRVALREAADMGDLILSHTALLTWQLRKIGAPI